MTQNHAQPLTGTEQQLTPTFCMHRQTEFIGANQGAHFHRCMLCSSVLVSQYGRLWVLPALAQ